jgi:hypothetical protein
VVRPFVEAAGVTFPVAVDADGTLSQSLDFKVVPNGLLIDADGIIRWAKYGGFSIDNPEDVAEVERFLAGEAPGPVPDSAARYALQPFEHDLVSTKLRLGQALQELGRTDDAVAAWREALRIDPGNFTIRKQIWVAEHPEKFYPTIDFDWQQEQLARERAQEIAEGVCGPDGCPLPAAQAG